MAPFIKKCELFKKKHRLWINNTLKPITYKTRFRRNNQDNHDGKKNISFMDCITESLDTGIEEEQTAVDSMKSPDNITNSSYENLSHELENSISDNDIEQEPLYDFGVEINLNHDVDYDESDDDDDIIIDINEYDNLYNGCNLTTREVICDLMNIYVKQNVTKEALKCFLKLVHKILPTPNYLPRTLYSLFQFVEKEAPTSSVRKHNFCKTCQAYIKFCGNEAFCDLCKKKQKTGIFYELDVSEQIKFLFEHHNLADKLELSENIDDNVIKDIPDGSEYKRVNSRSDRQPFDLTLMLNTDGLSLVKSAKSHCWPLLLTIAELPPHLRDYYLITIGLWYDNDIKPLMNTFFYPFLRQFTECYNKGIDWVHPLTGQSCNSKVVVPLITADAPARAAVLNMLSHNGSFGCNICEIQTQPCTKMKNMKRVVRVYKYSDERVLLRCHDRMIHQAKKAENMREKAGDHNMSSKILHFFGIKGPTIISSFPFLKLSTCVIPEFMHSVLLGVVKQFLKLWTKSSDVWSLKAYKDEIETFINNIRPPSNFHRMPRSIFLFHFFKAQEFYNWALFYSLPTLYGKLPQKYFNHWILFITAIYKLLKDEITLVDLEQADICLNLFVRDIDKLYGNRQYTYNVHQLLHLILCVKRWGPLWATSAFPFENYNGYLGNCVHGSKNQGVEMIKNLKIAQAVRALEKSCVEIRVSRLASEHELLGAARSQVDFLSDKERTILTMENITENLLIFSRARIREKIFTSQLYKTTKNDDSFVKIKYNRKIKYASIKFFCKHGSQSLVLLQQLMFKRNKEFMHEETYSTIEHIFLFEFIDNYYLINIEEIEDITHLIRVGDYLCTQPNQYKTVR